VNRFGRAYVAAAIFWLNICLVAVGANVVAWLLTPAAPASGPRVRPLVAKAMHQIYPEFTAADVAQLVEESTRAYVYAPFVQYREKPSTGRFVTVDPNGFRRTKAQGPWPPERRHFNVYLFGASTTFNYGVPDDQTIASYLQDLLAEVEPGRRARVYNFGRGGYYSSQERILFEQLVAAGHPPDLAVFIDGPADMIFAYADRPAYTVPLERCVAAKGSAPDHLRGVVGELPVMRALAARGWAPGGDWQPNAPPPGAAAEAPRYDDPAVAERVMARYTANKRLAEAVAERHGVRTLFVWQPVPSYRYDLRHHVYQGSFGVHEYSRHGYPRAREFVAAHDMGRNFVWCADIQEGVEELLYVDQTHYSPRMSARLAGCIADGVRKAAG
jgi:hypothetical protein